MSRPAPQLVEAALAGGRAELDQLARAWLPWVYAWCHRLGGPTVDAEDAAHEILIIMCRRFHQVEAATQFGGWLFGITRRVIANHRRRAWVKRWVPGVTRERADPAWSPLRTVEAQRTADAVWRALDQLSAAHREVLVLVELEERTGVEVAELVGIPLGTVKSRLRAARQAFRSVMESTYEEVDTGPISVSAEVGG